MKNTVLNYEEKYVAFLDILGFREMVNRDDTEIINTYLKAIAEGIKAANDTYFNDEKKAIEFIVISDSIILAVDKTIDNEESLKNLLHLCVSIAMIQGLLAIKNIWLRGGISFGKTHFDEANHQIIGPSYIAAYDIENHFSKYPRVVLDNRLINELNFNNAEELIRKLNNISDKHILYTWDNQYTIKKDTPLFIDYIGFFLDNNEWTKEADSIMLDDIVGHLKNNIYREGMSVYVKSKWTIDYLISILKIRGGNNLIQLFELEKL